MKNISQAEGVASTAGQAEIVLNCSDHPLRHWVLDLAGLQVKLNVNMFGPAPAWTVRGNRLFVAAEQGVHVIDVERRSCVEEIHDISFAQWFEVLDPDHVLLAAEDQLLCFQNSGKLIWRTALPDVISTTAVRETWIEVRDMSGGEYRFSLVDGREQ